MKKSLVIPIIFISVLFSFLDMKVYGQEEKDSIEKIKTHGFYLEILGRSFLYSIGYEYQKINKKNSFGVGAGTSVLRHNRAGFNYINYYVGSHFFYEYGNRVGLRVEANIGFRFNPVLFTDKFDQVAAADRPAKLIFLPSNSLGIYYRSKNNHFHLLFSGYLTYGFYYYDYYHSFDFQPWFGIQCKYNLKIKK